MGDIDEKMDALTKKLKSERGARHPFEGHPLANHNNYTRNLYLRTLCALLLYQNGLDEAQTLFLDRIIAGAKAEDSAQDYLRRAMEISEKTLDELLVILKSDSTMKYSLALDMLLCCHLKECSNGQAEFMGEFFDALGLTMPELVYLTEFTAVILSLDKTALKKVSRFNPDSIKKDAFTHYTRLVNQNEYSDEVRGTVKATSSSSTESKNPVLIKADSTSLEKVIKIAGGSPKNAVISRFVLNPHDKKRFDNLFEGGSTLTFRNCEFCSGNPLQFTGYKAVKFEDCVFKNFTTEIVKFVLTEKATFLRCNIINCNKHYSSWITGWKELGGVITGFATVGKQTELTIDNCTFDNCGGRNTESFYKSSIISDCLIKSCTNSTFTNCWNYHSTNKIDPKNEKRVLFSHVTQQANNKIINSANLCPGWKP